jgi:hypothetical protein
MIKKTMRFRPLGLLQEFLTPLSASVAFGWPDVSLTFSSMADCGGDETTGF